MNSAQPFDLPHHFNPLADYRNFKKAAQEAKLEALSGGMVKEAQRFNPYTMEGGTVAAIAGDDFIVIGGDTRMSTNGAVVLTRHCDKVFKLGNIVLASTGFYGDLLQLVRVLRARMKVYQFTYNESMTIHAAAEMLSRTLYYKRFFPYYTQNILAGIDLEGKAGLYGYDPVGTIEKLTYDCCGAGSEFMQPFLDNQVGWKNQPANTKPKITKELAKSILRDGFRGVAERETTTGDGIYLITLQTGKPIEEEVLPLRGD